MEISEDSCPPVQRYDHDYYGNCATVNGCETNYVQSSKNVLNENKFIMTSIESEKKNSDSELNDYEVIEEEIVDSSSTSDDLGEDDDNSSFIESNVLKNNFGGDCLSLDQNSSNNPVIDNSSSSKNVNMANKTISNVEKSDINKSNSAVVSKSKIDEKLIQTNEINSCSIEKRSSSETVDKKNKSNEEIECTSPKNLPFNSYSKCNSLESTHSEVEEISGKSKKDKFDGSDVIVEQEAKDLAENHISSSRQIDSSAMSTVSGDDNNDFNDDTLGDEVDVSDVSSSVTENENLEVLVKTSSVTRPPRKRARQPPIMIGYRKRRKVQHSKKQEDDNVDTISKIATGSENGSIDVVFNSEAEGSFDDDKSESSKKSLEQSSSEENLHDNSPRSTRSNRKLSGSCCDVVCADKYCWICHKDGGAMLKCIACPRVYHVKCHIQTPNPDIADDPNNFHCPECSAVLKADNVNTRSPVLVTVNLEQLCTLLKHVINILKTQKDSHYFWGPVDTKEFPHYREYIVYPMDISVLEKNVKNKIYGCTEAFIADVKWIVHNSIVFNSKAAKITNVAKNLLKICKREIQEIETCAECYYNSLVRKDTWFIEVCKKPHLLVWARLKGYPPWPAKAMKCKEGNVDCRFFGAHDKAWVPLKDCFLYSKITPQAVKVKKGSQLECGIQELEKHIKKLKDKFGIFVYPPARVPYRPSQELQQLRLMLPNYNPNSNVKSTKYLIHPDRVKSNLKPKTLFEEECEKISKEENDMNDDEKPSDDLECEELDKLPDSAPHDESADESSAVSSENENSVSHEEKTSVEKSAENTSDSSMKSCTFEKSPDKSVIENTKINPTATKTELIAGLSANPSISIEKVIDIEKTEDIAKVRKLVSVKNIESINATVASCLDKTKLVETIPKNRSSPEPNFSNKRDVVCVKVVPSDIEIPTVTKSPVPKVDETLNSVIQDQSSSMDAESTVLLKKEINEMKKEKDNVVVACSTSTPDINFDLNKVKEEPIENCVDNIEKDDIMIIGTVSHQRIENKNAFNNNSDMKMKRSNENEDDTSIKKSKTDSGCRTVNITENVTLSLINQAANLSDTNKNRSASILKHKPLKSYSQSNRAVYSTSHISETNPNIRSKSASAKTMTSSNMSNITSVNKPSLKIPTRVVSNTAYTSDPVIVPTKSALSIVSPARSTSKSVESHVNPVSSLLEDCMSKFSTHFTKVFEETLDEHAGKGNLQAKIVMLQKEIQTLKRNHELIIDELKRDYEVQIAELRATSIAKTQFDLAAERLKFEQEKERAVKEAKSKQWCSNCQKSANYYCCWNTAYCDFECQKDHWIQHMHVCKNDVKKKTAESSENEPPRIMMQNEDTNTYVMNGCDKINSTFYQNRNNFTRIQLKNTNTIKVPRPLLPRVTTIVSSSTQSSTSSSGSVVVGSSQSTFAENNVCQSLCSSSTTTLSPSVYRTISSNYRSLLRQASAEFHK